MADPINIIVGCPVRSRDWIIRDWLLCIEQACKTVGATPSYLFASAAADPTRKVISEFCEQHDRDHWILDTGERVHRDERDWGYERVRQMVTIRNAMLLKIRGLSPDWWFSVDSDILLHEDALANLLDTSRLDYDAVGGKTYMSTAGRDFPSYAHLINSNSLHRPDEVGVTTCTCLMAIKLMSPKAYWVNYRFDPSGEDVGWSRAAAEVGLRLGFDGRVISKHVMRPDLLDKVDARCGY